VRNYENFINCCEHQKKCPVAQTVKTGIVLFLPTIES